jgi:branched-chain amino acid transport system permease protein
MTPGRKRAALIAAIGLALLLPLLLKNFAIFQLTQVMIYAIAILGLNLLTGFNGQFSLGHSAFYALGAYTAAILMDRFGVPYALTLPAAGLVCLAAGFLFGLPAVRLEGIYLALATFALAVATPQLLKLSLVSSWTGGVQGIVLDKPDAPFGLPLGQDQWLYYVTLAVLVLLFLAAARLVSSRSGRAFMAIRDNPLAARAMGIDITLMKASAFGVSAFYTGASRARSAPSSCSSSPPTAIPSSCRSPSWSGWWSAASAPFPGPSRAGSS